MAMSNHENATRSHHSLSSWLPVDRQTTEGFPGRWVGGAALVLGPLLMLAGVLLRVRYDFFYPHQLAAYQEYPALIAASYGAFGLGTVLMWPAVALLAARIGVGRPGWALWGGVLTVLGLFARTFHAGVDHLAFQLARSQGAQAATQAVGEAYGAFHVFSVLNVAVMFGWPLLAFGAYRAGVLGRVRALLLGLMVALPLGVLKGTTPLSVLAVGGLCAALIPLGVAELRRQPKPCRPSAVAWVSLLAVVALAMAVLGQAG